MAGYRAEGKKGKKKWANYNSIINFKKGKARIYNQGYFTQKRYHLKLKKK